MYNFDEITERHGTNSIKYDLAQKKGMPADVLPFWVADMDFKSPPEIIEALSERVKHGIFGYSDTIDESYFNALYKWYYERFGWQIRREWVVKCPGVVFAVCTAIRALTKPGDAVLIQQPVYYPFENSVKDNGRRLIVNPLIYRNGRYFMNIDEFERLVAEEKVRLFILCNPHNPVGRVWTEEELTAVGDICLKHGVYVISDEIHQDFVYPGYRHLVFASLKPEYADITVTCTAPSKTFNLPGLQISNIFISNQKIRKLFTEELKKTGYSQPNLMGIVACQAAYEKGSKWLDELIAYLTGNLELFREFVKKELSSVHLVEPEGTYLVWLDFSSFGLSDRELEQLLIHRAKLWLSPGPTFGAGGEGFQRFNIACPRSVLQQGLNRLKEAFKDIGA
ncbi:cystathionine beta-lyase PatB [Thermoclostridium stercorarium subsp. stercorarium DSM 8532]|jgi:cystathionine beta-lyase|uniref:cysteine-S-conjugate beta-lyase n=3 Tax=Thermoclostridium stercorarium TaxID=1510 RepID=L7VLA0_THES1|nr:MalY/PatB family protein [Thermoclostridium stercorarium]AGC68950.1 cystathionine beta-lyase PatB [Thermoclostridium stercorarium subsp. stercorarium DSM 8532]AGI39933.1 beta-cystathionase [Thermoclostridium stercorarium subsp. stercorarium DSM 8532]ANW99253.1 aminotransferase [Thermoclostridium stercorarium subsp. thermolacticum DSM 2910]ANX01881.1 aminotransferase [Thermoclostridium stercorarium subsp. leptospartum DSM 9219]UZQ84928.1 pyridoxal phosphate-dependent aminotransferase [Thermo